MSLAFHELPIELFYRIFDHLDIKSIYMSCLNVCKRLNNIIDTYDPYKVILILLSVRYVAIKIIN